MQIFLSSYTHKNNFSHGLEKHSSPYPSPLKNSIEIRLNNNSTCACHSFPFLKSQDIKKNRSPKKEGTTSICF